MPTIIPVIPQVGPDSLLASDITYFNFNGSTDIYTFLSGDERRDLDAGYIEMAIIGDYVWCDENMNAMQDPFESPYEGVEIEIFRSNHEKVNSAMTDSNGHYVFENLKKGDYYLNFYPLPGHGFVANQGGNPALNSDIIHQFGPNTTPLFYLNGGQHLMQVDAGLNFGVVPVRLWNFEGNWHEEGALIKWKVDHEINTQFYILERSLGNDLFFHELQEIPANNQNNYQYIDRDVLQKENPYYYRLKTIDFDGTLLYSQVIVLDRKNASTDLKFALFHSSVKKILYLQFEPHQGDEINLQLLGLDGKLIRNELIKTGNFSGSFQQKMSVSDLPQGIYVLKCSIGNQIYEKRIAVID